MRQVDFDRVNIGGLWLTTLLVFSHYPEGSYLGGVTHLKDREKEFETIWFYFLFYLFPIVQELFTKQPVAQTQQMCMKLKGKCEIQV